MIYTKTINFKTKRRLNHSTIHRRRIRQNMTRIRRGSLLIIIDQVQDFMRTTRTWPIYPSLSQAIASNFQARACLHLAVKNHNIDSLSLSKQGLATPYWSQNSLIYSVRMKSLSRSIRDNSCSILRPNKPKLIQAKRLASPWIQDQSYGLYLRSIIDLQITFLTTDISWTNKV